MKRNILRNNQTAFLFQVVVICLMAFLVACSDDETESKGVEASSTIYKVAVIMPRDRWENLNRISKLFYDNIKKAQEGLSQCTNIELEWIDETGNGWIERVKQIAADSIYRAIIGPYNSDNATVVAQECAQYNKTLVLPTVTSAELQRTYAGKGYMWCLAEPDIAQCEVMLTNAQLYGAEGVYLLVKNNSYGKTFLDWAAFQATELGLKIYKIWTYESSEELKEIMAELELMAVDNNEKDVFQSLLFIPSEAEDMVALDKAMSDSESLPFILHTICSDVACSQKAASLLAESDNDYEGYVLSASPFSGFNQSYLIKYGEQPVSGEAHFYDALLLLYYGLTSMEVKGDSNLNDALKRTVDGRGGIPYSWMEDDIRTATTTIRAGGTPDVDGVTGLFEFDAKKYTTVLHSIYSHWILKGGEYRYVGYESTDGSLRTSSSSAVWDWAKTFQDFDKNIHISYPASDERWALVIATSTSWNNYRHQADAFAMYQMLKRHGYDDDHIVLIVSDDYAFSPQNSTPGEIRVRTNGENVYDKSAIDYDIKNLSPSDLRDILSGKKSERLPQVLYPDLDDNVFVFWSGHGSYGSLPWRESGQTVSAGEIRSMIETLSRSHHYRQMLFAIESCYSGSIGESCKGIPGLLVLTAANSNEPSWAEQKDAQMHIYLSNAFTRTFEEAINGQPDIKLRDLYYNLARTTSGSHVMVYNEALFGNLYDTPMTVFLNK